MIAAVRRTAPHSVGALAALVPAVYVDHVESTGTVIRRILLVEDDPGMREAIRRLLERAGFSVTVATDGAEAWELLSCGPRPAAILADLYTPRMTGHDLVARVRRTPRLARIPIIAMSAERSATPRPAAEAFLEKPFSSEQLDSALQRVGADL
jgi:two-component system chemotaxis response regulator CheY